MQYARLGDTGLVVSRLSFGAMTFGAGDLKAIYKVDAREAATLVGRALDAGVNFFNTADAYAGGQSEEILGQALGRRRADVAIATKVGFRTGDALVHTGLSARHVIGACEASLKRLGTDWIDVYNVHRLDPYTPVEETLAAFDLLVRQGKVRYVGFSNWPAWRAAKAVGLQQARGYAPFRAAELYYSLVGRDIEHELVPFTQDAGIGVMVWSPLASGFLSGKYTRHDPSGGGGRLIGFDILPVDRDKGYDVVDRLKAIAAARRATPAQVAIAWLLAKTHVTTVLVGASRMTQLEDNLGAADLALTADEVAGLDSLTAPTPTYPNWFNATINDAPIKAALEGRGPSTG